MKNYEFLEHTADVKFIASGKTLEKAFENCAYALTDTMTNHKKIAQTVQKEISVESEDNKALLYDFLEQFLILVDTNGFILGKIKSIKIEKNKKGLKLTAKVVGDTKIERYEIDTHIKAVTYSEMFIKRSKGSYSIQVILDI